jgi:hypothetical protein
MKRRYLFIIITAIIILAILVSLLTLLKRSPVLIVTDYAFISLYGEKRIKNEAICSSLKLFRPVRTIAITDESGDDILLAAISAVSEKPFCILFSTRFAGAAHTYHRQNDEIPVVILQARSLPDVYPVSFPITRGDLDDYFIYSNDIDDDFYRIGQVIAAIDGGKNGRTVVFVDSAIMEPARDAINKALMDTGADIQSSFINSYSQFSRVSDLNCIVLAGSGYEYLEKPVNVPVICYSWLDPEFLPFYVALYFDDSPWAQIIPAVKMVISGEKKALIPSRAVLITSGFVDKDVKINIKKILKPNIKKSKKL